MIQYSKIKYLDKEMICAQVHDDKCRNCISTVGRMQYLKTVDPTYMLCIKETAQRVWVVYMSGCVEQFMQPTV